MVIGSKSSSAARKKALSLLVALIFLVSVINVPLVLAGQYELEYDSAGNLVKGLNHSYEYDGFNQLKLVRDGETGRVVEEYWYGPEGSRIKKVHYNEDGTEETFYYIGNSFVRRINDTATTDANYYYFGGELVAKKESGKMLFFHPDNLGSTSLITDESGSTVEKTAYLPFGEVDEGGALEARLYTGKELDRTGLAYYGARYYSPFVKQFIQPDTILPDIYDPQQLNRYAYVRNNPYKYTDPSGNVCVPCVAVVAGIVAAVTWAARVVGAYFVRNVLLPTVSPESQAITPALLQTNTDEYGPVEGSAITAGEMAVGGAAGAAVKAVGRAVGRAARRAGSAVRSVRSAFRSAEEMMASKGGSLGAPTKTVTPAFRQFEGKEVPRPDYTVKQHKEHILPRHHDLTRSRGASKFIPGEGGKQLAEEVYEAGKISSTYGGRFVIEADLGRVVGTRGETAARLVIDKKTGFVVTQHPIKKVD